MSLFSYWLVSIFVIICAHHLSSAAENNIESTIKSFSLLSKTGWLHINHRHGGSLDKDESINITTASINTHHHPMSIPDDCEQIIKKLTEITRKEDQATLWKQLGKKYLDLGEYAEAYRIFRYGAKQCPLDEGLSHHAKVYDAFHGNTSNGNTTLHQDEKHDGLITKDVVLSSDNLIPLKSLLGDDELEDVKKLFLSMHIPPDQVPKSIYEMAHRNHIIDNSTITNEKLTGLLHASYDPILSPDACEYIIKCAVDAAQRRGGWTTNRHIHAPTCDIPVYDLESKAVEWIRHSMINVLFPYLVHLFPDQLCMKADKLRIQDLFVVRYDGENDGNGIETSGSRPGFASLRPHQDESIISLTIALNNMNEYEGGGLYIASTGDLLNGNAGTIMAFAGEVVHGGYPVTKGTRWILTVFLYLDENNSGNEPGYLTSYIQHLLKEMEV